MMKDLVLVKLGGSVITDKSKPYTVRRDIIRNLAKEIKEALDEKKFPLIVGHGSGSFGHTSAAKYQTHKGAINKKSWEGFSRVQNDAARLNRIVVEMLMKAGLNAVSIQPSACCVAENGDITEWYMDPLRKLLEKGAVPVPYGDVVLDKKKGFCVASTEEILDFLAKRLGASRIIMVGKVDGVFGSDGKIIKEINPRNLQAIKSYLRPSDSTDVTGGMVHKVEKMVESTKGGRSAMIINGLRSGRLKSALLGKQTNGTVIVT